MSVANPYRKPTLRTAWQRGRDDWHGPDLYGEDVLVDNHREPDWPTPLTDRVALDRVWDILDWEPPAKLASLTRAYVRGVHAAMSAGRTLPHELGGDVGGLHKAVRMAMRVAGA